MRLRTGLAAGALALTLVIAGAASAAPTAYTSDAAWTVAAPGALTLQSFEGAPTGTTTSLNFGNVNFHCTGSTYCPGSFGHTTLSATDGSYSVFFATPDTATFTFNSAITAFGIDVIDLGTNGVTDFFIDNGSGPLALQTNYSAPGFTVTFAGLIDSAGFTQITFSAPRASEGILFDRLRFGGTPGGGAIPEPATWAMMILGFGAAGSMIRRRKAIAA